jgi:hypothetical protein
MRRAHRLNVMFATARPARNIRRTTAAGVMVALTVVMTLTGCTSSKHGAAKPPVSAATRWWSNAAAAIGSTISPSQPTAAAAKLNASRDEYCTMLKQTLAVGKSLLPSATAKDPRLLTTTEAFVAEIEAVAPGSVQAPWHVLGPVILQLVRSGGVLPTTIPANTAANLTAAGAINTDAKANCHVDLSAVVTGG